MLIPVLPTALPPDELLSLLNEIDAESDLEAFTDIAASSVRRCVHFAHVLQNHASLLAHAPPLLLVELAGVLCLSFLC